MEDPIPQIEFIDPQEDPDDVEWLDGHDGHDEVRVRAHESARLPPRTTARRVLGSLLVLVLALAATGYAGSAVYRHDEAVEQAANTLVLQGVDVGDPVTLLDPGALGGAGSWRIQPSAPIAVDVVNESPDPITLLPGATLYGPGLTAPATLRPSGPAVLRPGQTGRLTGVATVDCSVQAQTETDHGNSVLVQARTTDGAVGVASVALGGGGESVRQQICVEQGQGLASSFFPQSVNSTTHAFTVTVSAHSLAAQPLHYEVVEAVATAPAQSSGVPLSTPTPVGPVSGTLQPGGSLTAGFTVHITACPAQPASTLGDVELEVLLDYHGTPAIFQMQSFDLGMLVRAACGLLS
jgi:hypothetical protein